MSNACHGVWVFGAMQSEKKKKEKKEREKKEFFIIIIIVFAKTSSSMGVLMFLQDCSFLKEHRNLFKS